eukprot:9476389-Pyramimonas_sp.AAC.3
MIPVKATAASFRDNDALNVTHEDIHATYDEVYVIAEEADLETVDANRATVDALLAPPAWLGGGSCRCDRPAGVPPRVVVFLGAEIFYDVRPLPLSCVPVLRRQSGRCNHCLLVPYRPPLDLLEAYCNMLAADVAREHVQRCVHIGRREPPHVPADDLGTLARTRPGRLAILTSTL